MSTRHNGHQDWIPAVFLLLSSCFPAVDDPVYAATVTALSCSAADVQNAIAAAKDGDTVLIPAGTSTWREPVTIGTLTRPKTFIGKGITLQGAGMDKTTISGRGDRPALLVYGEEGKPLRVTGISFCGQCGPEGILRIAGTCKNFRVDHCKFLDNKVGRSLAIVGHTYGLVDHCQFIETGPHRNSGFSCFGNQDGDDGSAAWGRPLTLGTANAVYIEDCYIIFHTSYGNGGGDNYDGARWVARHNIVYNGDFGCHGLDSGTRSNFSWEVYDNTLVWGGNIRRGSSAIGSRGGTGVAFNNYIYDRSGYYSSILLSSYRSKNTMPTHYPICDGANPVDGNGAIETGVCTGKASASVLVCAGKHWAVDQWKGYWAWNLSDQNSKGLVLSNDKDTIVAVLGEVKESWLARNAEPSTVTLIGPPIKRSNVGAFRGWTPNQWVGYTVINQKDFSSGIVTANTEDTITAALSGGVKNRWEKNDLFKIMSYKPPAGADFKWEPGDNFKLANGYPGLDQNGFTNMREGTTRQPQQSAPIYEWNNKFNGGHKNIRLNGNFAPECYNHLKENRDYFNQKFPFTGAEGVGVGKSADRPLTGAPGVAYWVEDQPSGQGRRGILHQCTAPGVWTEYYVPYQYPHPLQGAPEPGASESGPVQIRCGTRENDPVQPNPHSLGSAVPMVFQIDSHHGKGGEVNIRTIDGTLLKKLKIGAGETKAAWDGRDESGEGVALGIYIYEISENGGHRLTGNLAIVR
jgi:hypothetical protein